MGRFDRSVARKYSMRRGTLPLVLGGLGALLLIALALCPAPTPPPAPPKSTQVSQVVVFPRALRYCLPLRQLDGETRVQVLVDGSGSMAGIRGPVLRYVRW